MGKQRILIGREKKDIQLLEIFVRIEKRESENRIEFKKKLKLSWEWILGFLGGIWVKSFWKNIIFLSNFGPFMIVLEIIIIYEK